jgi:NAD-dependent SIR2 family protein deacetylase
MEHGADRRIGFKMVKHIYNFSGYAGQANCSECDNDTQVNEYDRDDGLIVELCKICEDRLEL